MPKSLMIVGAPCSAGAYAPGQEQAPEALRQLGLLEVLKDRGVLAEDGGDVPGFRWRPDRGNPRAMNAVHVADVAKAVAAKVSSSLERGAAVLVLGGDCTVELGTVAGASAGSENVGLIYIDLDTDLKTPETTDEGALDWMGVAHLLNVEGALPELAELGPKTPLLQPHQLLFFACDNVTSSEEEIIQTRSIKRIPLSDVVSDPTKTAFAARDWAKTFDRLLIHVDVDVLDFTDMPIAENTRRNSGLNCDTLMSALTVLAAAPNLAALTLTELNPDHSDEATLQLFMGTFANALAAGLVHS